MLGSIVILITAGILFPLLMIEVAAHMVPGLIPAEIKASIFQIDPPFKVMIPDKELGYKYAPNLVDQTVSSQDNEYSISTVSLGYDDIGFRDDGILNEDVFAVVIGDSFANCSGVQMEGCWVELLEKRLDKDFANLSVLGYSPQQEARMLNKYGLPLKPKLVLWVFFANDVKDAWRFEQFGSGAARDTEFWQSPTRTWLVHNSATYTTFSFFWFNRFFFYNLLKVNDDTLPRNPNVSWWLANVDLTLPEIASGYTLTQAVLLAANEQTLAYHSEAQFVVVILPFREQVYTDAALQSQFDHLNDDLVSFLQQNEIPVIDLTSALRETAKAEPQLIYFEEDIHLNVRGNEIVAELLKQNLAMILDQ